SLPAPPSRSPTASLPPPPPSRSRPPPPHLLPPPWWCRRSRPPPPSLAPSTSSSAGSRCPQLRLHQILSPSAPSPSDIAHAVPASSPRAPPVPRPRIRPPQPLRRRIRPLHATTATAPPSLPPETGSTSGGGIRLPPETIAAVLCTATGDS
ncbi:hypothetical protein BRADI_3g10412v3, partial [Brachypodium distachyon]